MWENLDVFVKTIIDHLGYANFRTIVTIMMKGTTTGSIRVEQYSEGRGNDFSFKILFI